MRILVALADDSAEEMVAAGATEVARAELRATLTEFRATREAPIEVLTGNILLLLGKLLRVAGTVAEMSPRDAEALVSWIDESTRSQLRKNAAIAAALAAKHPPFLARLREIGGMQRLAHAAGDGSSS